MNARNISIKINVIIGFIVSLLLIATPCLAATYYVDNSNKSASDSNPGTANMPWKTIQKSANVAVAGDTVYVKAGVYKEKVTVKNSGKSGSPIVFMAYPGDTPILDGTGISLSRPDGLFTSNNNNYITLDGFHVRNSAAGYLVRMAGGTGLTLKNCLIHTNQTSGVLFLHVTASTIENNEVYDSGHDAINVLSSSNVMIRYNYIHDNPDHAGVNIFPVTSESQIEYSGNDIEDNRITGCTSAIYTRYQTHNTIANNIIYDNVDNGIYLENDSAQPHNFNAYSLIANNTITGNGQHAVLDGNANYLTIKNNIIYANSHNDIYVRSSVGTGNTVDHNYYSNPNFTNAGGHDYTLQTSSPCIDAGVDLRNEGITDDIDGTARPQGAAYDIGAYEYKTGKAAALSPPLNLRIMN